MYIYVAVAFIGGLIGAYFGALKFKQAILKNILASALLLASIKLIFANTEAKPTKNKIDSPAAVSH
jgi:uncharacterized membrane protein YfcA